jgi:nucleotide-binding universal stress UspA family protein
MYNRILVPVDGSPGSDQALGAAVRYARDHRSALRLVHLADELTSFSGFDMHGNFSAELMKVVQQAGTRILEQSRSVATAAGVDAEIALFEIFGGHLGETIAQEARRWNADLIVLGTHGRRGVGRLLLGSGAEQIIRLAPVPVLVIRAAETAD